MTGCGDALKLTPFFPKLVSISMVITLKEIKPLKDHLQSQIEAKVTVALKKRARWSTLAVGLAVVLMSQPEHIPFTHYMVAQGIQDVKKRAPSSLRDISTQMLILSKYGLLRKSKTNYCNEYYINITLLPEEDL
jgi:hypothetical protein